MTGPGFADALARFSADLDAVVVRARRVAAEAGETSARFRGETRQLAERLRAGQANANSAEPADDRLRRAATGFRADHGLPVERLPDTPGAGRATPPGRRIPPPGDDDEDFSLEQIMR